MSNKSKNKTKLLCLSGIMAALYTVLDILAVGFSVPFGGNLKISLSGLPIIIAALLGGPLWGAAVGFVGAIAGQLITYGLSATTFLWVIPAVVRGLSVGLLFRAFKYSLNPVLLTLEVCISSLLVTLFNTIAMLLEQRLYGYYNSYLAIFVAVPTRIIAGLLSAVVFSIILIILTPLIRKGCYSDEYRRNR